MVEAKDDLAFLERQRDGAFAEFQKARLVLDDAERRVKMIQSSYEAWINRIEDCKRRYANAQLQG